MSEIQSSSQPPAAAPVGTSAVGQPHQPSPGFGAGNGAHVRGLNGEEYENWLVAKVEARAAERNAKRFAVLGVGGIAVLLTVASYPLRALLMKDLDQSIRAHVASTLLDQSKLHEKLEEEIKAATSAERIQSAADDKLLLAIQRYIDGDTFKGKLEGKVDDRLKQRSIAEFLVEDLGKAIHDARKSADARRLALDVFAALEPRREEVQRHLARLLEDATVRGTSLWNAALRLFEAPGGAQEAVLNAVLAAIDSESAPATETAELYRAFVARMPTAWAHRFVAWLEHNPQHSLAEAVATGIAEVPGDAVVELLAEGTRSEDAQFARMAWLGLSQLRFDRVFEEDTLRLRVWRDLWRRAGDSVSTATEFAGPKRGTTDVMDVRKIVDALQRENLGRFDSEATVPWLAEGGEQPEFGDVDAYERIQRYLRSREERSSDWIGSDAELRSRQNIALVRLLRPRDWSETLSASLWPSRPDAEEGARVIERLVTVWHQYLANAPIAPVDLEAATDPFAERLMRTPRLWSSESSLAALTFAMERVSPKTFEWLTRTVPTELVGAGNRERNDRGIVALVGAMLGREARDPARSGALLEGLSRSQQLDPTSARLMCMAVAERAAQSGQPAAATPFHAVARSAKSRLDAGELAPAVWLSRILLVARRADAQQVDDALLHEGLLVAMTTTDLGDAVTACGDTATWLQRETERIHGEIARLVEQAVAMSVSSAPSSQSIELARDSIWLRFPVRQASEYVLESDDLDSLTLDCALIDADTLQWLGVESLAARRPSAVFRNVGSARSCAVRLRRTAGRATAHKFSLVVRERQPCESVLLASSATPFRIATGRDYRCELRGDSEVWLAFEASAGDCLSIETRYLESGMDTEVELYSSMPRERIARNDDGGAEALASRIEHIAMSSREYVVHLKDRSMLPNGACELRVEVQGRIALGRELVRHDLSPPRLDPDGSFHAVSATTDANGQALATCSVTAEAGRAFRIAAVGARIDRGVLSKACLIVRPPPQLVTENWEGAVDDEVWLLPLRDGSVEVRLEGLATTTLGFDFDLVTYEPAKPIDILVSATPTSGAATLLARTSADAAAAAPISLADLDGGRGTLVVPGSGTGYLGLVADSETSLNTRVQLSRPGAAVRMDVLGATSLDVLASTEDDTLVWSCMDEGSYLLRFEVTGAPPEAILIGSPWNVVREITLGSSVRVVAKVDWFGWVDPMDATVGRTGEVVELDETTVRVQIDGVAWWYPRNAIEAE